MTPGEKNIVRGKLYHLLQTIEKQIAVIEGLANDPNQFAPGTEATSLTFADGTYVLMPLLVAEAQVLNAIVHLKE